MDPKEKYLKDLQGRQFYICDDVGKLYTFGEYIPDLHKAEIKWGDNEMILYHLDSIFSFLTQELWILSNSITISVEKYDQLIEIEKKYNKLPEKWDENY